MTLEDWLKEAEERINRLDAELIALEYFTHPDGMPDRSWIILNQDKDIADIISEDYPKRELVTKVLETPGGYITHEELKYPTIRDAVIASQYTPCSSAVYGNYMNAMLQYAEIAVNGRAKGVPLAYIFGRKEFYARDFLVTPAVLIPRVETESIINLVKQLKLPESPRLVEVGTGSGCVAITLKLEFPESEVIASDVSEPALEIAWQNSLYHHAEIEFYQSNLFRDFEFNRVDCFADDKYNLELDDRHFDVVVANLPYVNPDWEWLDKTTLSYEPKRALYSTTKNGLSFYERFFKEVSRDINADYVIIEADPCQHQELIEMARGRGFIHLKTEGFCLLFENRQRFWWDYEEQKLIHKTEEELKGGDLNAMLSLCQNFEKFTSAELRERDEGKEPPIVL